MNGGTLHMVGSIRVQRGMSSRLEPNNSAHQICETTNFIYRKKIQRFNLCKKWKEGFQEVERGEGQADAQNA